MNVATRVRSHASASVVSSAIAVFTAGGASLCASLPTVGAIKLLQAGGNVLPPLPHT